jgi:hypothetical protein
MLGPVEQNRALPDIELVSLSRLSFCTNKKPVIHLTVPRKGREPRWDHPKF